MLVMMCVYVHGKQRRKHQDLEIEQEEEGYFSGFFLHEFCKYTV